MAASHRRCPVLLAVVTVLILVSGFSGVANAQEIIPGGEVVLTEIPMIISPILISPPPMGDLTGEGDLIGMPTGPIVIEPAPATNSPQPEVTAPPPSTLTASGIPDHANIWDVIFDGSAVTTKCGFNGSDPFCIVAP